MNDTESKEETSHMYWPWKGHHFSEHLPWPAGDTSWSAVLLVSISSNTRCVALNAIEFLVGDALLSYGALVSNIKSRYTRVHFGSFIPINIESSAFYYLSFFQVKDEDRTKWKDKKCIECFLDFLLVDWKGVVSYPFVVVMCSTVTKKSCWFVEIKDKTWLYPTWVANTSSPGVLAWSGSRLSLTHMTYMRCVTSWEYCWEREGAEWFKP